MSKKVYFAEYDDCIKKGDTLKEALTDLQLEYYSTFPLEDVIYYKAVAITVKVNLIETEDE